MCKLLNVSRQGYYHWLSRSPSNRQLIHEYLQAEIKRVFTEHNGRYGSPRIALQLYNEGINTNKRVVAMLMCKMNLCAKGYRKRKSTYTKSKDFELKVKENLLNREFDQEEIDKIWVTDITYIPCCDGILYLNTYIDLTTRIPRCYEIYNHMKKTLVIEPLKRYRGEYPEMIHSDQGSQYRSYAFKDLLEKFSITHSMSKPGTPADNAVIESFHKTIKRELVIPNKHKSRAEMKVLIYEYMDYYINKRIHTKFGMTPSKYQQSLGVT